MTNTNEFLPNGYEQPKLGGGYMKFVAGENKFRVLSKPIIGWEDWKDKKPLRFRMEAKPERPVDPKKQIKHFWAFVVWDYSDSQVKILEITQASIQSAIKSLAMDEEWGAPYGYDIKVIRKGEGMDTEYSVNPSPHKPITADMVKAFQEKPCNLEALYDGEDPFAASEKVTVIEDMPF